MSFRLEYAYSVLISAFVKMARYYSDIRKITSNDITPFLASLHAPVFDPPGNMR